jgi:hypothetical protein
MSPEEFKKAVQDNTLSLSFSSLSQLMKSPRDFKQYFTGEKKSSKAMDFGTMVHILTLEPHLFNDNYAVSPSFDRRTKAGKALFFEFERASIGKTIVSQDDYFLAYDMATAVQEEYAEYLVGEKEQKIKKELLGITLSGKCDVVGEFGVTDLKTSTDAHPSAFRRKATYDFHYYMQAAIYEYLTGLPFNIIVVDKSARVSPPIGFSDYWLSIGKEKIELLIDHYKKLQASGSSFDEGYGYWYENGKYFI